MEGKSVRMMLLLLVYDNVLFKNLLNVLLLFTAFGVVVVVSYYSYYNGRGHLRRLYVH